MTKKVPLLFPGQVTLTNKWVPILPNLVLRAKPDNSYLNNRIRAV